jgi:hypothetical protein
MIRNSYGRVLAKRRTMRSPGVMLQEELRNALRRAVVLEYHNGKSPIFPAWGWEKPPSMYVLRQRRMRLARLYSRRYQPVAAALFRRHLPRGREWPGLRLLIPNDLFGWVDEVWTQIGCTGPTDPM